MDLAAWWKARRWVALLDLIDQLPPTSRLRAALANDPEFAEQVLDAEGDSDDEPWSPPLTDWTTATAIAAEQRDLLQEAIKMLVAIKAGVPVVQQDKLRPPPKTGGKPFPRPVSAIDRARREREIQSYFDGLAVFSPHALN